MSGVYTELAKKRAEQSNGPTNLGFVPPLPKKPAAQEVQHTEQTKEPRNIGTKATMKQVSKEPRKQGTLENPAADGSGFDLAITPYKNDTFLFTNEELYAIEDLKTELKRKLDLKTTKYDIVRSAIHWLVEDYRQHGEESHIVQRVRKKQAR
jgi:hypothetical protein